MASIHIHLAVGMKYLEYHSGLNKDEFLDGIIVPDFAPDDKKSHYSKIQDKRSLKSYLANKISLIDYLQENEVSDDYQKGIFLHLITDYLFFNAFFEDDYLEHVSYTDFAKDLYYSYGLTNDYLTTKYNLELSSILEKINARIAEDRKEKEMNAEERINILPIDKLNTFIDTVASIELDKYRNNLLASNKNVLPKEYKLTK